MSTDFGPKIHPLRKLAPQPAENAMNRLRFTMPAAAMLALSTVAVAAEEEKKNPHLIKPVTKSVSVFKNGLGFFMREGAAKKRDGWVMAERIPPAKFGTLLIYSLNPKETVDIVGSGPGEIVEFDGVDEANDIDTKRKRLNAAKQLQVELHYTENRSDRTAMGKLVSVGPDFAILDTGKQSIAVPIAEIKRMQHKQMPLRIHVTADDPADADEEARLGVAYLTSGITWIPEYSVEILDDETAVLTLRGTLLNNAEDLIHCDVNFVVGVPHFEHQAYMAPIAVEQAVRSIGASVAPPAVRTQIMNRAAIVSNYNTSDQFKASKAKKAAAPARNFKPGGANAPRLDGPGGSDFTVYTVKDMTVRTGERAIVTLFKQKIVYTHIYRWNTSGRMQHYLQLHNETPSAWTTGPYLAMAGDRPLSQDLLRYTPRGGCAEIPVTAAINIAHSMNEVEVARKLRAHQPDKYKYWDLVTLEGTVKLRNFEKRPVEIVITAPVAGKPIEASDDGQLATDSSKLKLLERQGTVTWTVTLKADEAKTLKYKYERYAPTQ